MLCSTFSGRFDFVCTKPTAPAPCHLAKIPERWRRRSVTEPLALKVPHGLAMIESLDLLCIADREHMRVMCLRAGIAHYSGAQLVSIQTPDLGRVFGVAAAGAYLNGTHFGFEKAWRFAPTLHTPHFHHEVRPTHGSSATRLVTLMNITKHMSKAWIYPDSFLLHRDFTAQSVRRTGYGIGEPGFEPWQRQQIFLFSKNVLSNGNRGAFLEVKRPGREADHSYPSSVGVQN